MAANPDLPHPPHRDALDLVLDLERLTARPSVAQLEPIWLQDGGGGRRTVAAPAQGSLPARSALDRYRQLATALALADVAWLGLSLLGAHLLRFGVLPELPYVLGMVPAALLWLGVFWALGLYTPHHMSQFEEIRRTISGVAIGVVLVILLTFGLDVYLSRSWMALTLLIALGLELGGRGIMRHHIARLKARETLVLRTLVIGSGEHADELIGALEAPGSGYRPIGYVDAAGPLISEDTTPPAVRIARLRGLLRSHRPDCLFIASPTMDAAQMVAATQAARQEGVLVRVYTHLSGILASRISVQAVGREGVALTLKPAQLTTPQRLVKRTFDLALAIPGALLALPLLVTTAIAVKISSGGPVLFRQERVTEGGKVFRMYKFRTMTSEPETRPGPGTVDRSAAFFKLKDDPRVTKVGKVIRRLSLDELPQLFNVIRGDMSLVGPRPLSAEQVMANVELLAARHEVRAGLTGWWQINGRSELTPEESVRKDLFYIENWSLALDVYILLRTLATVVRKTGAY